VLYPRKIYPLCGHGACPPGDSGGPLDIGIKTSFYFDEASKMLSKIFQ